MGFQLSLAHLLYWFVGGRGFGYVFSWFCFFFPNQLNNLVLSGKAMSHIRNHLTLFPISYATVNEKKVRAVKIIIAPSWKKSGYGVTTICHHHIPKVN